LANSWLEVPTKIQYTDRMKIKDLIEHLNKFNPEADIHMCDVESETKLAFYDIAEAADVENTVMIIVETDYNDDEDPDDE